MLPSHAPIALLMTMLISCSTLETRVLEGDSWENARSRGSAQLIVLYVPAEGFAETDVDAEPRGVTIDLMRAFAVWLSEREAVDVHLDFRADDDWARFYGRVREARGGVFGLGNVTVTDARRREIAFSPPYMTNAAVLISPSTVSELEAWEHMSTTFGGLKALAFEGTLHEARLREVVDRHHPDADVALARSNAEIIDRVEAGGYFAYVDGYNVWRAQERGVRIRHHAIGDDASEAFGIIMPLGSDWVEPMGRFMVEFAGSSSHRAIFKRHLGERLTALIFDRH